MQTLKNKSYQAKQVIWSRGIASIRRESLIVNLPDSEKRVKKSCNGSARPFMYGLYKLNGGTANCG